MEVQALENTHVVKTIIEDLVEKVLKWNIGVTFQIAALQTVMVDSLSGDTIHHVFNIPVLGKQKRI